MGVTILNELAVWWLHWMGLMAWQIVIFAVIVKVSTLCLRRSSARLRHLLWLLVFIKLILPPVLAAPWSVGNWVPTPSVTVQNIAAPADSQDSIVSEINAAPAADRVVSDVTAQGNTVIIQGSNEHLPGILFVLWFGVSFALIGVLALQWRIYVRRIRRELLPADESTQGIMQEIMVKLEMKEKVSLRVSTHLSTPGVIRIRRPIILLPAHYQDFSEREITGILAHELAHVQRKDLLLGWLTTLLVCMYWFHPVVWLTFAYLRREREMACDDTALMITRQDTKEYASTILRVAESFSGGVPVGAGFLGLLELSDNLLHRIRSISDETRSRKPGLGAVLVLTLITLCLPMAAWPKIMESDQGKPDQQQIDAPVSAVASAPNPVASDVTTVVNAPGVALIGLDCVGSREKLGETSTQLLELITEGLASDPSIRLVERSRVESAFKELRLQQSGLVDSATAAQLGNIIGARVLISGKLMQLGGEYVITVRLVDTQTSEVKALRVTQTTDAGILALADAAVAGIAERMEAASYTGASDARADSKAKAMAQWRKAWKDKPMPRVVMKIPESHLGTVVPDPVAENEILGTLTGLNFPMVDVSTFIKRKNSEWWINLFRGPRQDGGEREWNLGGGDRTAADILHNAEIDKMKGHADLFIIGEAFSEYVGETHGFKSCRARVEIKVIDVETEKIVAAMSAHGTKADTGEFIAGKGALRDAGDQISMKLAQEIAVYWQKKQLSGQGEQAK